MIKSIIVAGLIACAIGCSSDGGGSLTPDQFEQDLQSSFCAYEVRCGLYLDQASCVAAGGFALDPSLAAAIAAGKVTWNGANAQACLGDIENESCDQTSMDARFEPESCLQIAIGTVATGSACESSEECVSGVCMTQSCDSACCPGTCGAASTGAAGQPCLDGDTCAAGNWCDVTQDDVQTCEPLFGSGSACEFSRQCPYGQGCAGGICKALPQVGEPCPDGACADVGVYCGSAGTCLKDGLPGAACGSAQDCALSAMCDMTSGQCVAIPTAGQPCTTECANGISCNNGTCMTPATNGAACVSDEDCQSDYCSGGSDGSDFACAPAPVCI